MKDEQQQKNLLIAVVLSLAVLIGYETFFGANRIGAPPPPEPTAQVQELGQTGQALSVPPAGATAPVAAPSATTAPPQGSEQPRDVTLAAVPRIPLASKRLHGSLDLRGGRLDDLTLVDYRETIDPQSPEIVLLSPQGAADAYFAQFGWVGGGNTKMKMPGPDTIWGVDGADSEPLTPEHPVTLSWDNGEGLVFKRTIAMDENYMFSVSQEVENRSGTEVVLHPYGLVARHGTPPVTGYFILHEGMLGVLDGSLKEISYADLQEKGTEETTSTGGWIGFTDKYWLTALVPDQKTGVKARFIHLRDGTQDKYQVDYMGSAVTVAAGSSYRTQTHLFAGAKEVQLLDGYSESLGVPRFDLAIDFGWFYFLTKPIFYGLIYINAHLGNLGVAILLLTVLIKAVMFPMANKSYKAMSKMKKLQPEMVALRERFGDDKVRLNQELMALYKREKTNPASGCLPILVQIPVFFALYKVLFVTIEMRHAPFMGWIQDLSAPDPTTAFNLFGLIPWTPPEFLMIGIWPLIMGVTMYLQQMLNPQPADPVQAKVFKYMPILFTFLLARFPAGLVIYWAWNNSLSILQQWLIMKKMGVKL